ncbi:MAG: DUF1643 domain-containing protein [Cyanobacteria bacterium P01_F01_bin.4]
MLTTVKDGIERSAIFDATGQYRYSLERRWPAQSSMDRRKVTFIMLNPSRADAQQDETTLRACIQFAQVWEYNVLEVVNLFAYCTAEPKVLKTVKEPVGEACDRYLLAATQSSEKIILAWGNHGSWLNRDQAVFKLLADQLTKLSCLACNQSGQPRHPLYVPRNTLPVSYAPLERPEIFSMSS